MSGEIDELDDQNNGEVLIDFTPVCWYGTACYRKNPEHFRKFSHPHLQSNSDNEAGKESVEIKIEIGHDAALKTTKSPLGHTHDWTAFVRCANQNATGFFLDKVEFGFPQNLARPPLVVNQPPFNVTDSGSRSFVMNIDISFKNTPDPKKTQIDYDLYLKDNASFSNVRLVKLIIQNPPSDFRQRLLLAGGVMVQVPDSSMWNNVRQGLPSTSITNKRKTGDLTSDECGAFGQLCTTKLRKLETLSPPQKTLAEKLISEVLFHAERKSLTDDSCVQLTSRFSMSPTPGTDTSPLQTVKTEPPEAASSTSIAVSEHYIKSEVDSPTSLEVSHQAIKTEVDSPSSALSPPVIKSEIDNPSSSSDIDECVILPTVLSKTAKREPIIIHIKEEDGD